LIFNHSSSKIVPMKLIVNGRDKQFDGLSLQTLIASVSKNPEHVIVELNSGIVKKDRWEQTQLKDGDRIELVTFVGGG